MQVDNTDHGHGSAALRLAISVIPVILVRVVFKVVEHKFTHTDFSPSILADRLQMRLLITRVVPAFFLAAISCAAAGNSAQAETLTPHTDRAVQFIRRQAAHLSEGNAAVAPEFFTSLAAANFVQSRLSSLNYALLLSSQEPLPVTVEDCLRVKAGICGNQVAAFLEMVQRLGLRARPVELYLHGDRPQQNSSHICAEVFYRDAWRMFDITWGTYFPQPDSVRDDLADIEQLRSQPHSRHWAVTNESDLWYQSWKASGLDPFAYLLAKEVDILRGTRGSIHLRASTRSEGLVTFQPLHQPNFIGRNRLHPDYGPLIMKLQEPPPDVTKLHLDVLGSAGQGKLVIHHGQDKHTISFTDIASGDTLHIALTPLKGPQSLTLQIQSTVPGGIAYLVFQTITLETP